jgi:hypothetical protein
MPMKATPTMHDASNHTSIAVGVPSLLYGQVAVTDGQHAASLVGLVCAAIIALPSILKAADILVVHAKELVTTTTASVGLLIDRARGGARVADVEVGIAIDKAKAPSRKQDDSPGLPPFRPPVPPESL